MRRSRALSACAVALLCFISWLFKLSVLVRLVSDSILVGFKAGAGLTIIMSQLPSLLGVAGGGHNFFDRAVKLAGQLGDINLAGSGDRRGCAAAPAARRTASAGKAGRPHHRGAIDRVGDAAWPSRPRRAGHRDNPRRVAGDRRYPGLVCWSSDELFPLAAGCVLLAYIEGVSAARSFAAKHGYALDVRQEFLGLGAANLAAAFGHGYPVAGGLSQSAVNDSAGARTPLALVICSVTLALCLLFFTGLLTNLPKAVLAAIVFAAVYRAGRRSCVGADVAGQPDRFLCRGDCAGVGAAARNPARRPAGGNRIDLPAAGARLSSECGVPRPAPGHRPLFGQCEARGRRAAGRRHRVPARSLAALHQCRNDPGGSPGRAF